MKISPACFTAFIATAIIAGCISSGQVSITTVNSSFVDKPSLIMHNGNFSDTFIYSLLSKYPQYFDSVLSRKDELKLQIIYTQIDRGKKDKDKEKISFTDHYFNVDPGNYFYPASTVKLPVAVLALQKLNELGIPGLNKNSTMITGADGDEQTEVLNDPTTPDGRPTIAHYIKKIFLVSDNDAFNRLYEFLGQEYINSTLHKMGYTDAEIIHRLNISLSEEENRLTNPVRFIDSSGRTIYEQPAAKSKLIYESRDPANYRIGKGFMRGTELVKEPFDFSKKNRVPLQDLHNILRSIIFPEAAAVGQRFDLGKDDYEFLHKYMSMMPPESRFPSYDTAEYPDTYVKFMLYGAEKGTADPAIRIFNKPGDAYGFLIDVAYIADFKNNIEFMVSAVMYCNSDGILNDDKYDYKTLGYPFFKHLGQVLYEYELKRQRKYPADLSGFRYSYKD